MKKPDAKSTLLLATMVCGLTVEVHAGSFTDNFSVNHNYKTQGIVGTPWSGMSAGVVSPSSVAGWDANLTATNTLTITNTGGAWVEGSDGPLLWKLVSGDFTNTVHVSDLSQVNYNFAGLMVRDPNTNSGQNWIGIAMFAEFGNATVYRDTINSGASDVSYSPPYYVEADKTTWPNWLQIRRAAGVLSLHVCTNGVDWEDVYFSSRTDLTGAVQVGIWTSTYSENQCWSRFQDFSVVGPDVNTNTSPNQATGLSVTPAVNALDIAWTPGAGSAGSIVVVRRADPVTHQPVDGSVYTGNSTFGSGSDIGGSNYVAYVGTGSSVTLTNVTPTIPYTVAVYAYSGSGASTVYALTNTPVATAAPFGVPTGIAIGLAGTNAVAVDDTIQASVTMFFAGGGQVDVTATSTYESSDSALAPVSVSGLVSGLNNGVVTITASNQTFVSSTNVAVVKLAVTDDFSTTRDYLASGIAGTYWNGLLLDTNDLPVGGTPSGATVTLLANANVTKAGRLTVSTRDSGFATGADSGFFLYRVVRGDFSISVQIPRFDSDQSTNAYHMPGLMVRAPFELAFTESFLQWHSFNEFGIGNFSRRVVNGGYGEAYFQGAPAQPFLMIQRETNTFKFYQKAHGLDAWTLVGTEDHPEYDGVALQVGLVDQTFTGNAASTEFDNLEFIIPNAITNNAPGSPSGLNLINSGTGEVSASWTAGAGSSGSILIAHPVTAVTRQPVDGDDFAATATADFSLASANLGASNIVVYAGAGNSVTVSNLPATQCYFSVYSFSTVNSTNYYNLAAASGSINLAPPPPQVTVGLTNVDSGIFQLSWPQGTLLEATNLIGPWTTNSATSPLLLTNPIGNKFFRVLVQ